MNGLTVPMMSMEQEIMRLRDGLQDVRNELQRGALSHVQLRGDVQQLQRTFEEGHREILEKLSEVQAKYVPVARYSPVERLVYGMIALVLIAVLTKLVATVVEPAVLPAHSLHAAPSTAPQAR